MTEAEKNKKNALLSKFYPYSGFNFCMVLDGFTIGFQKVSGIMLKNENYTPYHEGGYNTYVSIFRNEKKELNKLVLEKGTGFFNPTKLTDRFKVMLLVAYNEKHSISRVYGFSEGIVSEISVSEFDAVTSKVQLDTTTILYDTAFEIDITGKQINLAGEVMAKMTAAGIEEKESKETLDRIAKHNAKVSQQQKEKKKELENTKNAKLIY